MPRQIGERPKGRQEIANLRAKMPADEYAPIKQRIDAMRAQGINITLNRLIIDLLAAWAAGRVQL